MKDEGAALDDVDGKDDIDEPGHRDSYATGTYPESTRTSSSEAAEEVDSGACHDVKASVVSGEDGERIQDLLEKRRSSLFPTSECHNGKPTRFLVNIWTKNESREPSRVFTICTIVI